MFCPWIDDKDIYAGLTGLRGALTPDAGLFERPPSNLLIARRAGSRRCRSGSTTWNRAVFELQKLGVTIHGRQQTMHDARRSSRTIEIMLLSTSAAGRRDDIRISSRRLKPGVKKTRSSPLATKRLYELGSDDVESINAVSGERLQSASAPTSSDRHHPAGRSSVLRYIAFNGYRRAITARSASVLRRRHKKDASNAARVIDRSIDLIRPGVMTDTAARVAEAERVRASQRNEAFGLQFGPGWACICTNARDLTL